jgi:Ni/Fe-hydrogenase subunit HybB-like protein
MSSQRSVLSWGLLIAAPVAFVGPFESLEGGSLVVALACIVAAFYIRAGGEK